MSSCMLCFHQSKPHSDAVSRTENKRHESVGDQLILVFRKKSVRVECVCILPVLLVSMNAKDRDTHYSSLWNLQSVVQGYVIRGDSIKPHNGRIHPQGFLDEGIEIRETPNGIIV